MAQKIRRVKLWNMIIYPHIQIHIYIYIQILYMFEFMLIKWPFHWFSCRFETVDVKSWTCLYAMFSWPCKYICDKQLHGDVSSVPIQFYFVLHVISTTPDVCFFRFRTKATEMHWRGRSLGSGVPTGDVVCLDRIYPKKVDKSHQCGWCMFYLLDDISGYPRVDHIFSSMWKTQEN